MNWDALGAIGELVGAAAVVLTLGYLAVQIRQNSNLAAGAAQRELMNAFQSQLDHIREAPDVFQRGLRNLESMSRKDQLVFHTIFCQFVNHLEMPLRMLERGLETQDNVDIYGDICLAIIQEPGGKQVWKKTKPLFFPLARQYIEARLSDPKSLPPLATSTISWFLPDPDELENRPNIE